MTDHERLERELTSWLVESAAPRRPDYTDTIIRSLRGVRQRPRWTFPERVLPTPMLALQRRVVALPWRSVAVGATALALLIATLVALSVGRRPRLLPAPFGPAANGLVAYSLGGDIFTVDPGTGVRSAVTTGPTDDHDPRFSLDGTRIAFLRETDAGNSVVIADAAAENKVLAASQPFTDVDPDGIAWSPDGRVLAVSAGVVANARSIVILDAATGRSRTLPVEYVQLETYWRPPDGRQLMFLGSGQAGQGLFLVSPGTGALQEVPLAGGAGTSLRLLGWTPDGGRFAYQRDDDDPLRMRILDLAAGTEAVFEMAFGHLSNDGRRIVGLIPGADQGRLCIGLATGGPCDPIGRPVDVPIGSTHESIFWSPDDRWIVVHPAAGGFPVLLDPQSAGSTQPQWLVRGADSWQRLAP
jgi:hypothetical protein